MRAVTDPEKLPLEQRRERLQEALASQMVPGMRIEAQTDLSASIVFAGGQRRVFTVGPDGTVAHQDFSPDASPALTPNPVTRSMGVFPKLLIILVTLVGVGYCASYMSVVRDEQLAGVTKENPWFTMRSRDTAIEITLRNGATALTAAQVTINDRWVCDVGAMRQDDPVVMLKSRCVGDDGLPMPDAARAVKVSVASDRENYRHTQTFNR